MYCCVDLCCDFCPAPAAPPVTRSIVTVSLLSALHRRYKNCFEINAPLRVYILAAESTIDMNSWIKVLNAQRQDANQNNHIQLAEFFTSDYESSRTSKEHKTIEVCDCRLFA